MAKMGVWRKVVDELDPMAVGDQNLMTTIATHWEWFVHDWTDSAAAKVVFGDHWTYRGAVLRRGKWVWSYPRQVLRSWGQAARWCLAHLPQRVLAEARRAARPVAA